MKLIPIVPKRVKVGGGKLNSEFSGNVQMRCKDGSSMLLSNVFFVPNLGVNLLLVRRLYQAGLNFVRNQNELFLKLGNKVIIEARMSKGLYIVTHVAQGYEETAFNSVENNSPIDNTSYLVTTLKKRIKIPRDLDICKVCALTRMKNRIPKVLSPWSKVILGQVQFDVAVL